MKQLKDVIQDHLTSEQTLRGVLMDFGVDRRMAQIMVNLYRGGIVDRIRRCGSVLPRSEVYNLIYQQEKDYGTSPKFAEEGIRLWAEAMAVRVEDALESQMSKPVPSSWQIVQQKPQPSSVLQQTSQSSPAPQQEPNFFRETCRKAANLLRIWSKLPGSGKKAILGIAVVLLVLILVGIFSGRDSDTFGKPEEIYTSSAAETIQWSLTDGVLRISGTGAMPDYVSTFDQPWYEQEAEVTSIVIEDGVTRIGSGAFQYMDHVVDITMADTVTEIGDSAFYSCTSLQSVQLSNCLEMLGSGAFQECKNLNEVQIPDCVKVIQPHAFFGTGLQSVELSAQCRYSYRAFPVFTAVTDGRPVSGTIGENATWELGPDGRLTISGDGSLYPDGLVYNEAAPWYSQRDQISTVSISEGITDLGLGLFANCQNLTGVTLPRTLLDAGWDTFQNCTALATVTLPQSVQEIGSGAFAGRRQSHQCQHTKRCNGNWFLYIFGLQQSENAHHSQYGDGYWILCFWKLYQSHRRQHTKWCHRNRQRYVHWLHQPEKHYPSRYGHGNRLWSLPKLCRTDKYQRPQRCDGDWLQCLPGLLRSPEHCYPQRRGGN